MASTAANRIPDEIVSEILTPLLKHPDKVFSDRSKKPLLAPGYSSSTYLLVCKTWLRVSTPLLYNVVILRTTAQAEALQTVLQSNKEFGLFIKKLRVEGGFGNPMQTILKCAPNITDLFLTFFVWSSDSVRGLCSGLTLINPRRVIVVDANGWEVKLKENKQVTQLFNSLLDLIPRWDNLKIFEFPYVVRDGDKPKVVARADALASALAESPSLETLIADIAFGLPYYISRVTKAPSLKSIHFIMTVRPVSIWGPQIREAVKKDPKLEALVTYGTEGPLSVHDALILADSPPPLSLPLPSVEERRQKFGFVSHNDIPALEKLAKERGHIIEELKVDFIGEPYGPGSKSKIDRIDCAVLASFTSLTRLTWAAYERMLLTSPPPGFSALDNLQMLSINGESPSLLEIALHQRLDSLRELKLGRQILVPAAVTLLKSRAAQLTHLTALVEILRDVDVFDLCTSLNTLTVILPWTKVANKLARNALPEDFLTRSTPHNTLEKIRFEFPTLNRDEPALKHIFKHLDPASFPALKEIQLDCIKWPDSEQQARKNKWIPFSELLSPKGIKLTDSKGLGGTRHIK
ncbi:F-box domain-containing protein [Mycena venus]|uniref:F-box domain-containing protein n=1 Tax=Mycena venus TaxID=2733690 RepID=A0A8H7CED2_9AGAR|nr:F-box domain-containing protein [Mycena venus]